jgi:hypothetical protein
MLRTCASRAHRCARSLGAAACTSRGELRPHPSPAQRALLFPPRRMPGHWRCLGLEGDDQGYVHVRPARAAALARPPPPRAPHVQSCVLTRRLRRDMHGTQVSGDVSGWKAMTQATVMCVLRAPLRSLARRRHVHLTWRAASPPVACADTWTIPTSLAMYRAGRR